MKSKKALFIIIPLCIAIVALIVTLVLFLTGAFLSPKARVMLALSNTFGANSIISDFSGNAKASEYGYIPEYINDLRTVTDAIRSMQENGYAYQSQYTLKDLTLGGSYDTRMLSGLGLSFTGEVDHANRLAHHGIGLKYNILKLSVGELYYDDTSVSLEMPEFFDGYLTVPTDTFGSSYNASAFPDLTGYTIPEELEPFLSFSLFELTCNPSANTSFTDIENNMAILQDFYDDIEVEKTDGRQTVMLGTQEQDCDEYRIMISAEAVSDLLDAYEEWYLNKIEESMSANKELFSYLTSLESPVSEDLSSDLTDNIRESFDNYRALLAVDHEIYVYLDRKNRLTAASYTNELYADDLSFLSPLFYNSKTMEVSASITFHGEKYLPESYDGSIIFSLENAFDCEIDYTGTNTLESDDIDNESLRVGKLEASVELEANDETFQYDISSDTSYHLKDRELIWELSVSDKDTKNQLDLCLECQADISEEAVTCDIDKLSATYYSGEEKTGLSLAMELSYSPLTKEVPVPSGTKRDLFTMSKLDILQFAMEIKENLDNNAFASLLEGM